MADIDATQTPTAEGVDPIIDDGDEFESKEIQLMKQRVEEMEREAKKLRELQAAAESANGGSATEADQSVPMETEEDKSIADGRSVFVGNVDYGATPEEIQAHFQACGTINRVTILCDKFTGHPKGFAYVEFAELEHIDAALAMDNSLFRGRLIKLTFIRHLSSNAASYPFSKAVILPPLPPAIPASQVEALRQGKGIMAYLQKSLPHPAKQKWLATWFARRHPDRLLPGSVLSVSLEHAPTTFSGVLLSIRRRGLDTSFTLRNVIQRTGVEMQFFVNSPHVKDIKILQRAGGGGGKEGRRQRRAKLFFLRDTPEKMTAISAGVKA
ncbi:RNA-binding domain-containing protein [Suillus decipiens]|nr:RNA-binding domain-containing protein [Suillus decipiens]